MTHTLSPDLLQAVHLFFADQLFRTGDNEIPYRIDMDDIKREFRKKALAFHPDRAAFLGKSRVRLEEKFKEINEAYSLLKEALIDKHLILNPRAGHFSRPFRREADFTHPETFRRTRPPRNRKRATPHGFEHTPLRRKTDRPPFFYSGILPKRKLRLGEFLFYNRIIAWQTLIDAIVWQYHVRPKLGQIALELNYLNRQDILQILKAKRLKEPFGQAAVRLGFLDSYKRFVLLGRQRSYNLPFGKFFIEKSILDEMALAELIQRHRLHNVQY